MFFYTHIFTSKTSKKKTLIHLLYYSQTPLTNICIMSWPPLIRCIKLFTMCCAWLYGKKYNVAYLVLAILIWTLDFVSLTISTLKSRYLANSLYNLYDNYDVTNKIDRDEYKVIISILLKATKECSVLKVHTWFTVTLNNIRG